MMLRKSQKIIRLSILIIASVFGCSLAQPDTASAWIGTGSGGGSSYNGNPWSSGGCSYSANKYAAGCAGVSWAFYKAQEETNSWVEFPYINQSMRVSDAWIPPECSKHKDSGFWHFGINSFGAYIVGNEIWTTTDDWAREYGSPWWGHWLTLNPGHEVVSWAPYKTSSIDTAQWVGVYKMNKYGSWGSALEAYQEAYLFDHPGASKPSYIPDNVWGFCYWPGMKEVTLTVKSIDTNGNSLSSLMADKNDTRAPGEMHSVEVGPIPGYTKLFWGTSTSSSTWWDNTGMTYSEAISANKTIYAVYVKNIVQGKSDVGTKSTGWQSNDKTADTYLMSNCSPTDGCQATFKHALRRYSGTGSTSYTVVRESNYWNSTKSLGVEPKNPLKTNGNQTFSNNGAVVEVNEATLRLYPGQVVCERMTFKNNPDKDTTATTAVCASALGDAQPKGDDAFLNIVVKNNDVARYSSYQKEVYAKPGDTVNYQSTYHPLLQYTYNIVPQKIQIDGGTIYPASGKNTTLLMWKIFNDNKGSGLKNWNNDFSVWRSDNNFANSSLVQHYGNYDNGDTSEQKEANDYRIEVGNVGKSIDQKAITNYYEASKTTPSQVTFYNSDGYNVANVITNEKSSVANVRVPYNYKNTTAVKKSQNDEIVYAGEETSIFFDIRINPKSNTYTMNSGDKDYATSVANGEYRLDVCVGGHVASCSQGQKREYPDSPAVGKGKFTSEEGKVGLDKMYEGKPISQSLTIQVPDVEAGTDVCVVSRVWPANSGGDNNYNDPDGNHQWASSEEKCFKVAKKPSLQVWGGNIYSSGDIEVATAKKTNMSDYDGLHVFGSWGELGIIASGEVTRLASGAGFGYSGLGLVHEPGGSTSGKFCDSSTLSFANNNCSNNTVGKISSIEANNPATRVINKDRDAILRKFGFKDENNESNILYKYEAGNFEIDGKTIDGSTIQVYQSDETITIMGDMLYEDIAYSFTKNDGSSTEEFVPKLIIMAKNIDINCYVERIDGLLIADSTVTTSKCDGSEDINAEVNSHPLTVNGAIIADKLVANRTYGAATGDNSIVAAETINFDPSLYLFPNPGPKPDPDDGGSSIGSGGKRNYLDVTYIRELAPRY